MFTSGERQPSVAEFATDTVRLLDERALADIILALPQFSVKGALGVSAEGHCGSGLL